MVDTKLEKIHRLELKIALEVKRICEKHNIKYFLIAGTLLGAVRHGGFIPWDDDMDIGMLREDYERFVDVCKSDLDSKYFLQTWNTDMEYPLSYAKIRLNGTHFVEKFSENSKIHNGIFIDIFPFDSVPDNENIANKLEQKYRLYTRLLWIKKGMGTDMKKQSAKQFLRYYIFRLYSLFFSYKAIKRKFASLQIKYNYMHTKRIVTNGAYGYKKETISRKFAENLAPIIFEGEEFMSFADYDGYLTYFYGDFMQLPPEEKRGGHFRIEVDFGDY